MITITEHNPIDAEQLKGLDLAALKRRINYDTSRFEVSKVNLIKYEFDPLRVEDVFRAYFRIGAEWLDVEQTIPLVVMPKMKNIDFIEMFMTCFQESETSDDFSSIYDIDFDAKPIKSKALSSVLSPLLIVQFLMVIKRIALRGLRKGYIVKSENLTKVKGRLRLRRTEHNALTGHGERVFCTFDDYSIDTPENKYIKRALLIADSMVSRMSEHRSYGVLSAMCNQCLSAFDSVTDEKSAQFPNVKANKLYKEYTEALRLARMILRRQDIAIHREAQDFMDFVPVFRIDMALLFEHYTLALLRRKYGNKAVMYQVNGFNRRFRPDFLIVTSQMKIIADTKYIDYSSGNTVAKPEYIQQLSGYNRDTNILKSMGIDISDENNVPLLPCVLLYPTYDKSAATDCDLFANAVDHTIRFYISPITVPTF